MRSVDELTDYEFVSLEGKSIYNSYQRFRTGTKDGLKDLSFVAFRIVAYTGFIQNSQSENHKPFNSLRLSFSKSKTRLNRLSSNSPLIHFT